MLPDGVFESSSLCGSCQPLVVFLVFFCGVCARGDAPANFKT